MLQTTGSNSSTNSKSHINSINYWLKCCLLMAAIASAKILFFHFIFLTPFPSLFSLFSCIFYFLCILFGFFYFIFTVAIIFWRPYLVFALAFVQFGFLLLLKYLCALVRVCVCVCVFISHINY